MSTLSIPSPQTLSLSFSRVLGGPTTTTTTTRLFLHHSLVDSQLTPIIHKNTTTIIRMGGGPRTYPGGVSKWQWKRMQAKKAKQLLKARLARERHIYEMRKRAELKAAVSELEKPWDPSSSSFVLRRVHAAAPTLFSVSADEQLKVLADRFQKPGGFDLWSPRDGPQLFRNPNDYHHQHLGGGGGQGGAPPPRFSPKGIVHIPNPDRQLPPPPPPPPSAGAGAGSDADVDVVSAAVSAEPETPVGHKKTSQPQPELRSNFDSERRRRGGGVDRWISKGGVPRSPNASLS